MPPDLSIAQQPAVFVVQKQETKDPRPRGLTGKLTLHGFIWIYVYESAANELPGQETHLAATDLNALIKAIDDALVPDTTDGACTPRRPGIALLGGRRNRRGPGDLRAAGCGNRSSTHSSSVGDHDESHSSSDEHADREGPAG
jgi:hypothetical protein